MPEYSEFKEDLAEGAKEASRKIGNLLKRQYRLRLTNNCRVCNNLNLQGHEETHPIGILDLRYADIRFAARTGCRYCVFFRACIEHLFPNGAGPEYDHVKDFKVMLQYHDESFLELALGYDKNLKFEVFLPPGVRIPSWPQLRNSGTIARHSDDEQCFGFIKKKIHDCEHHSECNRKSSSLLPRRVLDVGAAGGKTVKVLENAKEEGQRYIALSYCWGGHLPLKSTTSNISGMRNGIPWNELPQVFKDVIHVAWKLNVQYVWIDSLCILQDSREDWEIEASKMAVYYSQAYLVVACSTSPNPTIPFIAPRDPDCLPTDIIFVDTDGTPYKLKLQKIRRLRYMTYTAMDENIDKAHEHDFGPLSKRAWVWQENALATRIVHYTSHGLVFECRGDSGVYGEEMPTVALPLGWIRSLPQSFAEHTAESHEKWHELVKTYSGRDLSFHADKLPAIGGAAAEMSKILNSDYLAGLWRNNLLQDLLWHADNWEVGKSTTSSQPPPTPLDIGSPSWSWASLNGRISYKFVDAPCSNVSVLATIRDCQVGNSKHSEFGQCHGGYLVLSAPAIRARLSATIPTQYYGQHLFHIDSHQHIPECLADTILAECETRGISDERRTLRRAGPINAGRSASISGDVLCVLIQQRDDTIFTLVLARSEIDPESFVRIGFSRVDHAKLDIPRIPVFDTIIIR